jgi:thiamine-phosphate pyrophosphorylase
MDWSFYGVVDAGSLRGRTAEAIAELLILGGAGIVQYRDKTSEPRVFFDAAAKIRTVTKARGIPFIVNDRVDVALAVEADGVHVGQKDLPISTVRRLIGRNMLLGVSVSRWDEFMSSRGADYLGLGPIFPSRTKRDAVGGGMELVRTIRSKTSLPLIGIGGICLDNVQWAIGAGCDGVAAISAVMDCRDIPEAVRRLREAVQSEKTNRCFPAEG